MGKEREGLGSQTTSSSAPARWKMRSFIAMLILAIGAPVAGFAISGYFIEDHAIAREVGAWLIMLALLGALVLRQFGKRACLRFVRNNAKEVVILASAATLIVFLCHRQNPEDWVEKNIVSVATVIGVIVAVWTLILNAWISLRNQRIDVRILCIQRYDEFAEKRPDLAEADDEAIFKYFRRHWAIKKDQLDFWIAGYVDPEALVGWFMSDVGYFSGASTSITKELFLKYWERVREVPGSVDKRLSYLVECIQVDIVPLQSLCPHPQCDYPGKPCPNFQRAGLFWLLMDMENRERWSIRGRKAHGIGRETFAGLMWNYPDEAQERINAAEKAIKARREEASRAAETVQAGKKPRQSRPPRRRESPEMPASPGIA